MSVIKLNDEAINEVNRLKKAEAGVDVFKAPNINDSKLTTIEAFINQQKQLSKVIKAYKELIEKDSADILSAFNNIQLADKSSASSIEGE